MQCRKSLHLFAQTPASGPHPTTLPASKQRANGGLAPAGSATIVPSAWSAIVRVILWRPSATAFRGRWKSNPCLPTRCRFNLFAQAVCLHAIHLSGGSLRVGAVLRHDARPRDVGHGCRDGRAVQHQRHHARLRRPGRHRQATDPARAQEHRRSRGLEGGRADGSVDVWRGLGERRRGVQPRHPCAPTTATDRSDCGRRTCRQRERSAAHSPEARNSSGSSSDHTAGSGPGSASCCSPAAAP